MEILIALLIEWLRLNTAMDIEVPPEVAIMTPQELADIYGAPVHALYDHRTNHIYLANDVDLSTIQGASVLLHELVHHYQNVSGAMGDYTCARESERLAYETQRDYLEANNAKVMVELDPFNIFARSMCNYY